MRALILGAVAAEEQPASFLLPTRQAGLFGWCLDEGLRVIKPVTYMAIGGTASPLVAGSRRSSIDGVAEATASAQPDNPASLERASAAVPAAFQSVAVGAGHKTTGYRDAVPRQGRITRKPY